MKKVLSLILLVILSTSITSSCDQPNPNKLEKPPCLTVLNVYADAYTDTVITHDIDKAHPVAGTVGGSTIGYLLVGGWVGVIAGGLVGNAMSDHQNVVTTSREIKVHYKYIYLLSDSSTDIQIDGYRYTIGEKYRCY